VSLCFLGTSTRTYELCVRTAAHHVLDCHLELIGTVSARFQHLRARNIKAHGSCDLSAARQVLSASPAARNDTQGRIMVYSQSETFEINIAAKLKQKSTAAFLS